MSNDLSMGSTKPGAVTLHTPGAIDHMAVDIDALLRAALVARQRAYAPYSNYLVGAALLVGDGTIIVGCNVENAAYPATICAERVALTSAIAQGYREFRAIAVATINGGTPCGICRQVMAELAPELIVYICDVTKNFQTTTVTALLPGAFHSDNLTVSPK